MFDLQAKGQVVMLVDVEGLPTVGLHVRIKDWEGAILDVGKNGTDGQTVSSRSCLTGKSVAAYASILIAKDAPKPAHGDRVTCEGGQDVH